ncbi:MAG: cytochrome c [Pseudomonadota bacterium]
MKIVKAVVIGALLTAGAVYAQDVEPTDPNAIARSELMEMQGMNAGLLGKIAKGEEPYDLAKAEAAKASLIETAAKIETVFAEQGAADPASAVKPEIWANWDDFLVKAKALGDAVGAMDVASAETIGAGMGAVGGACVACHKAYRVTK